MTSKKIVAVPKFCYMKVTLEFDSDSNVEMTAAQFKFLIVKMLKELFGQNSVPSVDVLLFKEDKRQAILRFQNSERTENLGHTVVHEFLQRHSMHISRSPG